MNFEGCRGKRRQQKQGDWQQDFSLLSIWVKRAWIGLATKNHGDIGRAKGGILLALSQVRKWRMIPPLEGGEFGEKTKKWGGLDLSA